MYTLSDQSRATATANPDVPATASRAVWIGGLLSVGLVLSWLLLIYNRYFVVNEGWFSYYGWLMNNGRMPYRDFYFFTQPISLLISQALAGFGDRLIYFRYYGLAERAVLTAALYYLLSREFSVAASVCGTVASSFLFLAYATDALFSYLYTCLLFFVLALVCLQKAWRSAVRRDVWMILAGVAASLSFFAKQSNGLLAIAAIALTILVVSGSPRKAIADLFKFATGVFAGSLPFVCWLAGNAAWRPYLQEVFLKAASSKGGLQAVFFGFITRQVRTVPLVCLGALVVLALAVEPLLSLKRPGSQAVQPSRSVALIGIAGAVIVAMFSARRVGPVPVFLMRYSSRTIVEILLYAVVAVFGLIVWRWFSPSRT